jgi:hypothetical protein
MLTISPSVVLDGGRWLFFVHHFGHFSIGILALIALSFII